MPEAVCPKCLRPLPAGTEGICSKCMPVAVESVSTRPPEPLADSVPASRPEDEWREPPPRKPIVQPHRGGLILFMGLMSVFLSLVAPCLTIFLCRILENLG